jgi:hypothetical protein
VRGEQAQVGKVAPPRAAAVAGEEAGDGDGLRLHRVLEQDDSDAGTRGHGCSPSVRSGSPSCGCKPRTPPPWESSGPRDVPNSGSKRQPPVARRLSARPVLSVVRAPGSGDGERLRNDWPVNRSPSLPSGSRSSMSTLAIYSVRQNVRYCARGGSPRSRNSTGRPVGMPRTRLHLRAGRGHPVPLPHSPEKVAGPLWHPSRTGRRSIGRSGLTSAYSIIRDPIERRTVP